MISIDKDDEVYLLLSLDEKFNPVTNPDIDRYATHVGMWLIEAMRETLDTFTYNGLPYYVVAIGKRFGKKEAAVFAKENWETLEQSRDGETRSFFFIDRHSLFRQFINFAKVEDFDNQPT